jgi:hypothetical protein
VTDAKRSRSLERSERSLRGGDEYVAVGRKEASCRRARAVPIQSVQSGGQWFVEGMQRFPCRGGYVGDERAVLI